MSSFHIANSSHFHYKNGTTGTSSTFFTNSTNGTLCHDSAQNEVSSGSAAFIAIALIFGCMTQLPGSLVTSNCNRFWRICPCVSLTEGLVIFFRMAHPLLNSACTQIRRRLPGSCRWHLESFEQQGRSAARTSAYALLAERLGNSRQYNYWFKLPDQVSAPAVEQLLGLLDEIASLEDGLTLRPVVIVPMFLQFFKLCIIKGGFLTLKALPLMYFWSWFWVEVLLLLAHGEKLGDTDMLEADKILHLSVAPAKNHWLAIWRTPAKSVSSAPSGGRRSEYGGHAKPASPDQKQAGITNEPDRIELRIRREQAWRQRDALLVHTVVEETFTESGSRLTRNRAKDSPMQRSSSRWIIQRLCGQSAGISDATISIMVVLLALDFFFEYRPSISVLSIPALFITIFLDFSIGVGLARIASLIKKECEDICSWIRDWLAFRVTMIIFFYFTILYKPEGTSKPDWLDWLG